MIDRTSLRFYGVGFLVITGLGISAAFRISTVIPSERIKALGYLIIAAGLGGSLMWSMVRRDGSPWRGGPDRSPGNPYWKLAIAGVVVPLLDEVLAGGTLLIAAGAVIGMILVQLETGRRHAP